MTITGDEIERLQGLINGGPGGITIHHSIARELVEAYLELGALRRKLAAQATQETEDKIAGDVVRKPRDGSMSFIITPEMWRTIAQWSMLAGDIRHEAIKVLNAEVEEEGVWGDLDRVKALRAAGDLIKAFNHVAFSDG